ncbi:MAG: OmpA family protein [Saprospiraceae bacterium]|nr:OmpA family protein [Saprospiraceae bacterium]
MYKGIFVFLLLSVNITLISAQSDTIRLKNPSFEDTPKRGGEAMDGISGWFDCGKINFPMESPPDIHPNGYWNNNLPASDRKTYLGMVVRDNGTYESVSVRIDSMLEAGKCYKFSIHLARAEKYVSRSRMSNEEANYVTPAVLRIWGGSGFCNERELLAESNPVTNSSWQINTFEIRPKSNIRSITFSAFYKTPTLMPYNGNLLVDGASAFIRVPCPGEPPFANAKSKLPPHKRKKNPTPVNTPTSKDSPVAIAATKNFKPKILHELNKGKAKQGQTIEIKNLLFKADSATIDRTSYEVLDDIYGFLMSTDEVIIEIGGYTNGTPPDEYCDRLSTARAKSVAEYLVEKGVDPSKVQFKGYGKKKPIADNKTAYGRTKNQRVEIKILNLNS